VFQLSRQDFPRLALTALDRWIVGAPLLHPRLRRPGSISCVTRTAIEASITHRLSNALVESVNTNCQEGPYLPYGSIIGLC
jgi:transposase